MILDRISRYGANFEGIEHYKISLLHCTMNFWPYCIIMRENPRIFYEPMQMQIFLECGCNSDHIFRLFSYLDCRDPSVELQDLGRILPRLWDASPCCCILFTQFCSAFGFHEWINLLSLSIMLSPVIYQDRNTFQPEKRLQTSLRSFTQLAATRFVRPQPQR